MMGSASTMRPMLDGMVMRKVSRIPRASSLRKASVLPVAAMRASSGSATVPSATPKIPSGSCINRKATVSQKVRSEEHTSELQSLAYLVCRLLLEKKKKKKIIKKKMKKKKKKKKKKTNKKKI